MLNEFEHNFNPYLALGLDKAILAVLTGCYRNALAVFIGDDDFLNVIACIRDNLDLNLIAALRFFSCNGYRTACLLYTSRCV